MLVYELMQFLSGCASGAKVLVQSQYTEAADVLSVHDEDGEVVVCGKDSRLVFGEGDVGEMLADISERRDAEQKFSERCVPSRWEVVGPNASVAEKGNLVSEIKETSVGAVILISQTGSTKGFVEIFAHEVPALIHCIQLAQNEIDKREVGVDTVN